MRIFFTVIIALLAASCTNNKKSTAQISESNDTIQSTIEEEISTEMVDTIPTLKDSVYQLTNYKLRVKEIDSVFIAPLYADQKSRDAIYKKYDNSYEGAKAVENYLKKSQLQHFKRKGRVLTLHLANGKTKDMVDIVKDNYEDTWYTYENYFPEIESYLVYAQFYEGHGYMVVNRNTGNQTYVLGEAYPNLKSRSFIAINADMEAKYSANGLQVVEMRKGSYLTKLTIEGGNWAPVAIKWIDYKSFIVKVTELINLEKNTYRNKFYRFTLE